MHLRQAYFYGGDNTADEHAASDSRMRLWDLTNENEQAGRNASTPVIGDPTKESIRSQTCATALMTSSAPSCPGRFF